jgi:hypothetical protein
MRCWNDPGRAARRWNCTGTLPRIAVVAVSLARRHWTRFSWFPMGLPAAGNRFYFHFLRAVTMAAARVCATAVATGALVVATAAF